MGQGVCERALALERLPDARACANLSAPNMPKTPLQVAAAAQDDAKTKKKAARGLLSGLAALLGLGASEPAAKSSKHTVTTKRVEMHEGDEDEDSDSGSDADSTDGSSSGGSDSGADAEAEEEESAEEKSNAEAAARTDAAKPAAAAGRTSAAAPRGSVLRAAYDAADVAYLAAVPEAQRAAAALRAPTRLMREARAATGERSIDGVFGALSALPERSKAAATIEAKVDALAADNRARRINEIVDAAKAEGRAGATSKDGRASLRALGMAQGSKFLRGFIGNLPIVARTSAKIPKQNERGEAMGAPGATDQRAMMDRARQGLTAEETKTFDAIAADKLKAANGDGARTTED